MNSNQNRGKNAKLNNTVDKTGAGGKLNTDRTGVGAGGTEKKWGNETITNTPKQGGFPKDQHKK